MKERPRRLTYVTRATTYVDFTIKGAGALPSQQAELCTSIDALLAYISSKAKFVIRTVKLFTVYLFMTSTTPLFLASKLMAQ